MKISSPPAGVSSKCVLDGSSDKSLDKALACLLNSVVHEIVDEPHVAGVGEVVGKVEGGLPDRAPNIQGAWDQGPAGGGGGCCGEQSADYIGNSGWKTDLRQLNWGQLGKELRGSFGSMKGPGIAVEDTEGEDEGGDGQLHHLDCQTPLYCQQSN